MPSEGETRQANAIWSAMPRPTDRGWAPWAICSAVCDLAKATISDGFDRFQRRLQAFQDGDPIDPVGIGHRLAGVAWCGDQSTQPGQGVLQPRHHSIGRGRTSASITGAADIPPR